jgi:hypothetical protein
MRIVLAGFGTRGDVQPTVALAQAKEESVELAERPLRGRCMARPRAGLLGSVQCRKEASSWQNAPYRSQRGLRPQPNSDD